jgi:hypothetical protein
MPGETNNQSSGQMGEELKNALKLPDAQEFANAFERVSSVAREVNNLFGQSRERIVELKTEIVNSLPGIARLGGDVGAVGDTIGAMATAARRNVIENAEDVEKLYASSKVLGQSVGEISEGFLNVGVGFEQMGKQLEDSVNYVRSIGGNAKDVMSSVRANMDQMNRYQFEGGVQGLTKMAAQASMLRFDMGETFRLADKVLTPEGAIETAAAFQRLGVSAGALADPFALMNQSINDPQGLQNSLVDVAKQFSYFDEKTKTFKISPQGVLTLKEMESQTGVSAKEMSKLAVAAAEADKRVSAIGSAGLNIKEEDKQYVANIARMGEGGEYEVKINDDETKKLSELTQEEFDKLIKEQKDGPKTMEEIAKSQMSISDSIKGDVEAIRAAIVGGTVTQKDFLRGAESVNQVSRTVTEEASKNLSSPEKVRSTLTDSMGDIKELINDLKPGSGKNTTTAISDYFTNLGQQGLKIQEGLKESLTKTLEDSRDKIKDNTSIDKVAKEFLDSMLGSVKSGKIQGTDKGNMPVSSLIEGTNASKVKEVASQGGAFGGGTSKVNIDGGFKVEVIFPPTNDFTQTQKESISKAFADMANTTNFQQHVINLGKKDDPTKAPTGKTYSPK